MNNKLHQETVKTAVKAKFRGRETVKSKTTPMYPRSAEREFQRITNGYMKLLNESLKKELPKIMDAYKKERRGDSRFDDARDLDNELKEEFESIAKELEQKISGYGLDRLIASVAGMTRNSSLREWKRAIRDTLGIDLMSDYYDGAFYEDALRRWIDENVLKIRSIPTDTLGNMRKVITDGFIKGKTIRDITKDIQEEYNVSKSKARSLARDQISTLNAQIARLQQTDAGCTKYRWSTSKDSRVRDCHRSLDGKTFSWDDPPAMWYKTKKSGTVYSGRHCHPGEDYCCRCVAIPVFDLETIDVPIK